MRALLVFMTFGLLAVQTNAQIDPSSALLLNSGSRGSPRENNLDSGRYDVRPKSETPARRDDQRNPRRSQSTTEPTTTVVREQETATIVGGGSVVNVQNPVVAPEVASTPSPLGVPQPTVIDYESAGPVPPHVHADPEAEPGAGTLKPNESLVDGRRLNLLELSVSPAFVYNDSDSSFFHRRYFTSAPAIGVEANVWFNPAVSLNLSYLGTLGGHVNDSFDGSKNVAASQQWFTAGIRSRRFFSGSSGSPVLILGLDYYEYQFRVSSESDLRERLKTTGARLSVESEFPTGPRHSVTLGFSLLPKLQHKEEATAIEFGSGGSVDANAVSISLGSRFEFDRTSAVFWKISHMIEKDLFSGDATIADPLTGTVPSGVAVTNSFTIFQFGYTWGN